MATKTFTQLTAVTTLAAGDELVQWNASAGAARKITVANFATSIFSGAFASLITAIVSSDAAGNNGGLLVYNSGLVATPRAYDRELGRLVFRQSTSATRVAGIVGYVPANAAGINDNALKFLVSSGDVVNEAMFLRENGNFLIGTTSNVSKLTVSGDIALVDGMTAPSTTSGWAKIYVDSADGDLKIKFGDGTVKTIVVDT